jgi:hypothetical protein
MLKRGAGQGGAGIKHADREVPCRGAAAGNQVAHAMSFCCR